MEQQSRPGIGLILLVPLSLHSENMPVFQVTHAASLQAG